MKNIEEQAAVFDSLADPTRLRLFRLLCEQQEPGPLCVNALTMLLGVSQPAVSQHLKTLKSAGLIKGKKQGYHMHYTVNPQTAAVYKDIVLSLVDNAPVDFTSACEGCESKDK